MTKLLKRFVMDRYASVAIEFALLGFLTFGLILETMQTALFFYSLTALDRATTQANRVVKIGNVSDQSVGEAQFRDVLCSFLPLGMPCANVIINVQAANEDVFPNGLYQFVRKDQSDVLRPAVEGAGTIYKPGGEKSYSYTQVSYAMPVFSPAWKTMDSANWNGTPVHFVTVSAVFKNEPHQSSDSGGSP